jgi:hypothetical protein
MPGPVVAWSQADFLSLAERLLPPEYLIPLQDPGPGYEVLQAQAAVWKVLSESAAALDANLHILTALDGRRATCAVRFTRQSAAAGAVTLKADSVVSTSVGGRRFVTTTDAVFGAGDVGPYNVVVLAVDNGAEYNVAGPYTTAGGEVVSGAIDTLDAMVQTVPAAPDTATYVESGFVVEQRTTATQGRFDFLGALGAERGLPRNPGESIASYRSRLRSLPAVVTPDALERALFVAFSPYSELATLIEPGHDFNLGGCWSGPPDSVNDYNADGFVWSDPRDNYPLGSRWLGAMTIEGCILAEVPLLKPISERGGAWTDPALEASEVVDVNGFYRSLMCWSAPDDVPGGVSFACWSGSDAGVEAVYSGAAETLSRIKAGGVSLVLWLQGQ